MRPARLSTAVAVLASSALLLAGCGGGDDDTSADAKGTSQKVAASQQVAATWPLTGLPVTGSADAAQPHPVLVAKMDNTASSAPQVGLGSADMVVEELVEGGLTRLAAFYYSDIPGRVGPVRSMRASDVGIVSPVKAAMVTSGAAPVTITRIKDAGIKFYAEGSPGFARDSSRSAPYNLFADLGVVAKETKEAPTRPDDYLPWGAEDARPTGAPARSVAASFGGSHTTNWHYDGHGYVNENSYAAPGDQFPATSVLVLRVPVGDAGYLDPAGNHVPETKLSGKGAALLFTGGRVVRGTWSKSAPDAALKLAGKGGDLTVPAGHTWIELVPAANGKVTFTRK